MPARIEWSAMRSLLKVREGAALAASRSLGFEFVAVKWHVNACRS